MSPPSAQARDQDIARTRRQVGWVYIDMRWPSEESARRASDERDALLRGLAGRTRLAFADNKLHSGELSPGCQSCGEGTWACQYLNSRCTASCFFCPQERQVDPLHPTVGRVSLPTPAAAAEFLTRFGFRSSAFSGGEPLLAFDTLVAYLGEIRRRLGPGFVLWVYTNGDLADGDRLARLRDAGCDELRFNLAARAYDLAPVELATRFLPRVTVEVPAIPEQLDRLVSRLRPMADIGVRHLNLHQLNTTAHNFKSFGRRGYTFLHHPPLIPVLDSELTALEVMTAALDQGVDLPINYCSCAYKMRIQPRGYRRRAAAGICEPFETITEAGYLRRLAVCGDPETLARLSDGWRQAGIAPERWQPAHGRRDAIWIHEALLDRLDTGGLTVTVSYDDPDLVDAPPADHPSRPLVLGSDKTLHVERRTVADGLELTPVGARAAVARYSGVMDERQATRWLTQNYDVSAGGAAAVAGLTRELAMLKELHRWEQTPAGFPAYY